MCPGSRVVKWFSVSFSSLSGFLLLKAAPVLAWCRRAASHSALKINLPEVPPEIRPFQVPPSLDVRTHTELAQRLTSLRCVMLHGMLVTLLL